MIIDAVNLLNTDNFDVFRIVSGDSNFTGLASRLRESGLVIYGFGEKKHRNPSSPLASSFSPKCFAPW